MDIEYRTFATGPQSVLGGSLLALGSQRQYMQAAIGLEGGVHLHRFASDAHAVPVEDAERIAAAIAAQSGADANFRADVVRRRTTLADHLLETARSVARPGEDQPDASRLLEGFAAYAEAVKAVAPFVLVTPAARSEDPTRDSEARREVRNFYRVAEEILKDKGAAGVLRTTSAAIGLRRIEQEFPALYELIAEHVDGYGWLRARGYRAQPMGAKDVVDRLQVVLLRWPPEAIEHLARHETAPDVLPGNGAGIDLHLQAEALAMPFFGKIAAALGCTTRQVLFASAAEIAAALAGQAPLPTEEIDRRLQDGFIGERIGERLEVSVDPSPSRSIDGGGAAPPLTGMTGCRGRAVGPVKVILDASDLDRLEIGDILVTAASTTDMMGGSTVFPTRGGGPPAIDKALAIVADEGGLLSHAAIVCRERGIPCVLGTEFATRSLHDGEIVEVDATRANGTVLRWELP